MTIAKPNLPQELGEGNEFLELALEAMEEEQSITERRIGGIYLEGERFSKLEVQQCVLENCSFLGCSFDGATFTDVAFKSCDFSNCNFLGAYFQRCQFISCKCVGTNLGETVIKSISAEQSIFRYASFDGANISDAAFQESDFTETSMAGVRLKRLEAQECNFVRNNFLHTKLSGMDFRGNEFLSPVLSDITCELKGIKVDSFQAVSLASLLGVKVED